MSSSVRRCVRGLLSSPDALNGAAKRPYGSHVGFRWGIWGTGMVSARFVRGLRSVPGAEAAVVASRSRHKARAFMEANGVGRATKGYDPELLTGVDAVYIATPTRYHAEHALACIRAGLPVLVEKPLAASAPQLLELVAAAQAAGVFMMEGLWTRFLPAVERLARAPIDIPVILTGSCGIRNAYDPARPVFDRQGGGAIGQYGIYPLALGQMIAGPAETIQAVGHLGSSGIDMHAALTVTYEGGAIGHYACALDAALPNEFSVSGTGGRAALTGPIFRPAGVRVSRTRAAARAGWRERARESAAGDWLTQRLQHSGLAGGRGLSAYHLGNGYSHEAAHLQHCVEQGLMESPLMPLSHSVELAELMDAARAQLTLRGMA